MTELLAATKKGLFTLRGNPSTGFTIVDRGFAGEPVEYALRDPRTGRVLAATTSPFYGPKIFLSDDRSGSLTGPWAQAEGVALPAGGTEVLVRLWVIVAGARPGMLYAGGDPGVLFESEDGGDTWLINKALWEHPSRTSWQPGGGGLCVHSIVPWPGDPDRLAVGISAAGVWLTDDGGRSWRRGNRGLGARYLPEEAQSEEAPLCIHHLERSPARPERMFMQFHGGVYRSDDAGESWTGIGEGLPSDFGFPLAVDPDDADSAYVIPLTGDTDRVTPGASVQVYETRDAGATWSGRAAGLPDRHAYATILRQAFCRTGHGVGLGLYFGTTSGQIYASGDAGKSWVLAADHLPPVFAITASEVVP